MLGLALGLYAHLCVYVCLSSCRRQTDRQADSQKEGDKSLQICMRRYADLFVIFLSQLRLLFSCVWSFVLVTCLIQTHTHTHSLSLSLSLLPFSLSFSFSLSLSLSLAFLFTLSQSLSLSLHLKIHLFPTRFLIVRRGVCLKFALFSNIKNFFRLFIYFAFLCCCLFFFIHFYFLDEVLSDIIIIIIINNNFCDYSFILLNVTHLGRYFCDRERERGVSETTKNKLPVRLKISSLLLP